MLPRWIPLLACAVVGVVGCSNDEGAGDPERFCGEVQENAELLTAPDLAAADDPEAAIDALLEEYRRIGTYAPLAIEAEWEILVAAYEAADEVVAGDAESEQEALEEIFRSERAAVAVATWLLDNCAVDIGPVQTIVPDVTTTVDPATTESP